MSTTSTVSDRQLFDAASRAYPDAESRALTSWSVDGGGRCEWCLSVSYERKLADRKWRIVARGWSRSELLLQLRSRPAVDRFEVVGGKL